jgi:hypothetical protein
MFAVPPIRIMGPLVSRLKIFRPQADRSAVAAPRRTMVRKPLVRLGLMAILAVMGACAGAAPALPRPRPIIIHSGARIRADHDEMKVVNEWVTAEQANISDDPSFWVITRNTISEVFPWEGMRVSNDSVTIQLPLGGGDASLVYQLYGHMHLMSTMGRQALWVPTAASAVGYELEREISSRAADAWILGRTVFDTQPFGPLDELAYAKEAGFLDAFIFTARPGEFATSRAEWARQNPGRTDEYRDWFLDTFNTEPPGIRANE